jgi:predicted membrane channel-forming protein YqfA (hemolysin III family)
MLAAALAWHGPIAQPANYHGFADARTWYGIPHAADVLSNLPFLLAGVLGLIVVLTMPRQAPSRAAWGLFFVAVAATTAGSAFYHWAPDDFGLAIDRMPIAWACAWITCALLAERAHPRCGGPFAQLTAFLLASASVWLWYRGATAGAGDLRVYLFVQFLPIALIPLLCLLSRGGVLGASDWLGAIGLYALAKVFEIYDHQIYAALGRLVSGHTLKHLFAAAAALWLAWRLARRVVPGG